MIRQSLQRLFQHSLALATAQAQARFGQLQAVAVDADAGQDGAKARADGGQRLFDAAGGGQGSRRGD